MSKEYVLGTDQIELDRLGLQHRLWSASAHQAWEKGRLAPGLVVLDIGCGPGFAAFDMAAIVGRGGRVLGVDESAGFVAHANARGLENFRAVVGDVHRIDEAAESAGFPRESFDFAYARWVLCFVKDPESVVRAVARALKRGGRFVVQDYFDYEHMTLAPKRPAFSRVIAAVAKSFRDRGGDPDVAGRLPGMLRRAGFSVTQVDQAPRLARPGSTIWTWPDVFWASFVPRLVATGAITEEESRAFFQAWNEASNDPDSFMMLPPVFDVVGVRE